jgi:hypothetical protein
MPTQEPPPPGYHLPTPADPLSGVERIRNLGGFGTLAMAISLFTGGKINEAIAVGEAVDPVAMLSANLGAGRNAFRDVNASAGGEPLADQSYRHMLEVDTVLGRGAGRSSSLVDQLRANLARQATGRTLTLSSDGLRLGDAIVEPAPPRRSTDPPRGLFQQLIHDPTARPDDKAGGVMSQLALTTTLFEAHPNRSAIDAEMRKLGGVFESHPGLVARKNASADFTMVVVTGPAGQSFTRPRVRYDPLAATVDHIDHELGHLIQAVENKTHPVEIKVTDPAQYAEMQRWSVERLIADGTQIGAW